MFPGQRDKQKSNFIAPPPGDLLVKLIWLELDQHLSSVWANNDWKESFDGLSSSSATCWRLASFRPVNLTWNALAQRFVLFRRIQRWEHSADGVHEQGAAVVGRHWMPSRAVHLPGQVEWVGVSGRNRGGSFVVPQRKPSGNVKGTRLLYSYYVVVVVVASKAYVNRVNIFRSIFHFFGGKSAHQFHSIGRNLRRGVSVFQKQKTWNWKRRCSMAQRCPR